MLLSGARSSNRLDKPNPSGPRCPIAKPGPLTPGLAPRHKETSRKLGCHASRRPLDPRPHGNPTQKLLTSFNRRQASVAAQAARARAHGIARAARHTSSPAAMVRSTTTAAVAAAAAAVAAWVSLRWAGARAEAEAARQAAAEAAAEAEAEAARQAARRATERLQALLKKKQLRCRVPPELDALDALHAQHWWLPSSVQIRPSADVRATKEASVESILGGFQSPVDFVLSTVFLAPTSRAEDGKLAVARPSGEAWTAAEWNQESIQRVFAAYNIRPYKLAPNIFPYALDEGACHYVMWYNTPVLLKSDDEVTRDISRELRRHVTESCGAAAAGSFDFGWYVNPKMTVPFLAHVQVFWVADPAKPANPSAPGAPA